MSHDRPTPAERAADFEHDPSKCWVCMNPSRHGEQAPDPEELAHAREVDALRRKNFDLTRQLESAEGTLNRHGFRRCDLPACNCGWWHAPEVKR